ncbi:MAG TPA: hypothetical protein ENI80_01480 [Acidiferrobacteraceae bacterium]|nr:hypothetical protein [Acidiferrobacteraceae bacterium]
MARQHALWMDVVGGCMAPQLNPGQRVAVINCRFYWPGDIVTFCAWDGQLLVHRMLGYRLKNGHLELVTCADRASKNDVPVRPDQVIGKVVDVNPPSNLLPVSYARRVQAIMRYCQLAWQQTRTRLKI